ncbi:MAG: HD domain-containing protein [Deltaproteobacteria bacterium]|nr:HD domain-containing protein [Deltaproteobacteria bacterium]
MKCPGQDTQYWDKNSIFDVKCPKCNASVEFFKDDTTRKCGICGHKFINPKLDFGCASYCKFARNCIDTLPEEFLKKRVELLKEKIELETKKYFGTDFKRISHALSVAHYADKIGKQEGGNMAVVMASAYLHDIGIPEAEKKHKSCAAKYQEIEGPPIAKNILLKLNAPADLIQEVCDIIRRHHTPRKEETLNFKILYDADLIVNLEKKNKKKPIDYQNLKKSANRLFFTKSGMEQALKIFKNTV